LSLGETTATRAAAGQAIACARACVEQIGRRAGGKRAEATARGLVHDIVTPALISTTTGASILIEGLIIGAFGVGVAREFSKIEWAMSLNAKGAVVVIFIVASGVIFEAQRYSA